MKCPKCEQNDSRVRKTYFLVEGKVCYGDVKARLHNCRVCETNFYTYEVSEDTFMRLQLTESRPLRRQPLDWRRKPPSDSARLLEQMEKRLKTKEKRKKP